MKSSTLAVAVLVAATTVIPSCVESKYVVQAGMGQLELIGFRRSVTKVLADEGTDLRTKILLEETIHIREFAERNGLKTKGNYRDYVDLGREAVVWFIAACEPLSFTEKRWKFPIVGSFPYLGWFDFGEALEFRRSLEKDGYDVFLRRVHAFSTGGWFRDPVLSTMLSGGDDAFRSLANTLLHELVHANVFIHNQSTFNESIASFVGDTMAEQYLEERFGAGSAEVVVFRAELAEQELRAKRLFEAYHALTRVYGSSDSDQSKLSQKRKILRSLDRELSLRYRPNNALLIGFRTYNAGQSEFRELYAACGGQWIPFLNAISTISEKSFGKEQADDIGSVIKTVTDRGCSVSERSAR